MPTPNLPELPESDWRENFMTNPPRLAAVWFGEAKMRAWGAEVRRQALLA